MQKVHETLRALFANDPQPVHKLRALWCLYVTGGAPESWLLSLLHASDARASDEHVRVWAVRLLGDGKQPSAQAVREFAAVARSDRSGLVLLYLASALQEIPLADRWDLADGLARRSDFAADRVLPLMIWYGIEAAVPENTPRALELAGSTEMLTLVRLVARRLTENIKLDPRPVDRLVALAGDTKKVERTAPF